MKTNRDVQIRDPYVVPVAEEGRYYLFGSTDANIWGKGTGFDVYVGTDLEHWEGPYPVFRPEPGFFSDENYWAPEVYEYRGRYYMFATFRRRDNRLLGTAVLVSDRLTGPFRLYSDGPVTPADWSCLDGTLHVDEAGQPWMVFCHEWTQVFDGEICAVRLTEDLKEAIGEPQLLFRASEAPWTTRLDSKSSDAGDVYVTDGAFLHRTEDGTLLMLWASFVRNRYALGVARSASGSVTGPWVHDEAPLFEQDGGHGMLFRAFDGRLMLTIHTPNRTPHERPIFIPVTDRGGKLRLA
ncbi:glycoside hydrolase family 43 protein [Paenibacillus thermoaerophilus]|uniref:Glycoside hydrolase family 43 protein n=1 Tax=Paenibacillus thermoaerophilus TaxID=1215385 RepID=A0ABW2V631_9BACL|nr:glycoside hydrolase family 43 protein [Paenibacillus thermoaerophilus]TMV06658.1 glycoside hydrolase [Paenibacillus thermoaerophilus]